MAADQGCGFGKTAMNEGAGRINAAQMLAEIGDERRRFQTFGQLAAEARVSPVTHASGK